MEKNILSNYFKFVPAILALFLLFCSSKKNSPVESFEPWQKETLYKNFFPIAVWLQDPTLATQYKSAGINVYVGLWNGPTEQHIADLKSAGMKVICSQNEIGLKHKNDPIIIGWMHGDEPDNAQWNESKKTYDPPILPEKIVANYNNIKSKDPSRPVLLNLGQGVAWDEYVGRGVRTNHPEDYPEYVKGCDIASFDIYPVVSDRPQVAGNLWYVARGVERLVNWSEGKKVVWNCIECTHISNPNVKPTSHQVRAEVWMSIIHGSMGLIYFVHQWKPNYSEHALLDDSEMLSAVTKINNRITNLSSVLCSQTITGEITVSSSNTNVPIVIMVKRFGGSIYVFSVAIRDGETNGTFTLKNISGQKSIEVLDENRTIESNKGVFTDKFNPYDVHLYKLLE